MEKRLPNIHSGEVLEEEFLKPLHISVSRLAQAIHVPPRRIAELIEQKRRITPNVALRLATCFGTSPQFWLGLQMDYDLEETQRRFEKQLARIDRLQSVIG